MEDLSGYARSAAARSPSHDFTSWSPRIELYLWKAAGLYAGILFTLFLRAMWERLKSKEPAHDPLRAYLTALHLSGLPNRFVPIRGAHHRNFNFAATGTPPRAVIAAAEDVVARYERKRPGSAAAESIPRQVLEQAQTELRRMFGVPVKDRHIHFFPGTGRALEAAIASVPGPRTVISSPFEHPTELAVARWCEEVGLAEHRRIRWDGRALERDWSLQADDLASTVSGLFAEAFAQGRRPILLLSEVCWSTGQRLPVSEIWKSIGERANGGALVVDGAHAVGNVRGGWMVDSGDAYVFSGHKWLGSGEPIGILLRRGRVAAYDASSSHLAESLVSVRALAGLQSALKIWQEVDSDQLVRRMEWIRRYLVEALPEGVRVVAAQGLTDTNLLALAPRSGYRWGAATEGLRQLFEGYGVAVGVVPWEDQEGRSVAPWVRVAISPFVSVRDVRVLMRALSKATQIA